MHLAWEVLEKLMVARGGGHTLALSAGLGHLGTDQDQFEEKVMPVTSDS